MQAMNRDEIHRQFSKKVAEMMRLRRDGWTLQEIADEYGVTRQRIAQVIGPTGDISDFYKKPRHGADALGGCAGTDAERRSPFGPRS